jgi:hypothetical protein
MHQAGSVENGVLVGHHDHLFLAGGAHDVLSYVQGRAHAPDVSFRNFEANILSRKRIAERHGIPYKHVVYPDKQSVMIDAFPVEDPICLGELYLSRCDPIRHLTIYPRDLLRKQSEGCFLHTDTHLSDRGGILVAGAIVKELTGIDYCQITEQTLSAVSQQREHCGDLGSKLTPHFSVPELFLSRGWGARVISNKLMRNDGIVDIWISPAALTSDRLLIFGDSFGRDLARIASLFFQETVFLRTPFFYPEMMAQIAPTHLLTQNVERYLTYVRHDADRPAFHMYPYFSPTARAEPDAEFGEIFSAQLSYGRKPYKQYRAKYFGDSLARGLRSPT